VQAEAVADVIAAGSERALAVANRALAGDFSRAIHAIRTELVALRSTTEALIDFADEGDVHSATAEKDVAVQAMALAERLRELQRAARQGEALGRHHRVVICGAPNAGKSTLMNALTGTDRAIVTAVPGTTRDVLTAELVAGGMTLTLADTAGLRETAEEIEREGIRRAREEIRNADLVLLIYEAGTACPSPEEMIEGDAALPPLIRVRNKIDRTSEPMPEPQGEGAEEVAVSALHRQGLDALLTRIQEVLGVAPEGDTPLIARARHLAALAEATAELQFEDAADFQQDLVLGAERLRRAHRALSELVGELTTEDLLGEIFGKFCIGK
jgi:tRNA modification GTPase